MVDRRAEAAAVNGERAAAAVVLCPVGPVSRAPCNLHDARPVISIEQRLANKSFRHEPGYERAAEVIPAPTQPQPLVAKRRR